METLEEGVNMFKFNNRNTRMTSMTKISLEISQLFVVFLFLMLNREMFAGFNLIKITWQKTLEIGHYLSPTLPVTTQTKLFIHRRSNDALEIMLLFYVNINLVVCLLGCSGNII